MSATNNVEMSTPLPGQGENKNNTSMLAENEENPTDTSRREEAPPRLVITKMELENFKSYGGVKEIGPFHKCFSSVVGPNGSGKSNVIDAMLFVFGKRAKKLRLNKVSELIHKSDAYRDNPPSYARVSVFFEEIVDTGDGDGDYTVVPNSARVVTRIAYKNSSSTYKLDGKNCKFADVAEWLGSKGIDLNNNRFLILQGEVEMISMMPPKGKNEGDEGLLEYLEDIIGSSKYVEETAQANEKVEALTEQRQEKLNRVKAVEKEMNNLEAAKLEAEALLSKEREIRRQKNILYQLYANDANQESEQHVEKKEEAQKRLRAECEKFGEAGQRTKEIEKGLKRQRKEHEKIHNELKQTKDEFTSYERRNIKMKEEIKHAKAEQKKIQTKLTSETKKEAAAVAKGQEATENIPELEKKIESLTKKKATEDAKLEDIYEDMKEITQNLRGELEQKTQELAPVNEERSVFQANLDTAETEVGLLEDATTRAKDKLVDAEKELASCEKKQEAKRQELEKSKTELSQARDRLVEAEREGEKLAEQEGKLATRNKELLARTEDAKASLQSQGKVQSSAVRGILKAARKNGELSKVGIVGRLGDLATIDEQYDVAVSTACSMLDHIVVQTTAGAQRCLEFLRKHNLGRANFIPLDKMKKGAHDRVVETPENAPRLFELIAPANYAITPAIFMAVAHTLVAPDLETATRWAYDFSKRWRVVTLDGKLIETAGTMSGGGKNVRRGGMRLRNSRKGQSAAANVMDEESSEDAVKKLEAEAAKCQELLQECKKLRKKLTEEVRALKKTIKNLEVQIPKLELKISGFDTTKVELAKLIPELQAQSNLSDADAAKLVELKKKVEKCKTDMSSCAMLASKLEADVARLQKSILDAGGSKLKKQQKICEKVLADLKNTEKELASTKVTIKSSKKSGEKARKAIQAAENQLEKGNAALEKKKADFEALEEEAAHVSEAFEKVKELEAEKRVELEAASKEFEELKKAEASFKCVEVELLGQIDEYEKQIVECKKKKKHWAGEIKKLRQAAEEDDDYLDDEADDDDKEAASANNENESGTDNDMEMQDNEAEVAPVPTESADRTSKSALPILSSAGLEKYKKGTVKENISVLETERNSIAKNANMGAIAEYRKKETDYLARVSELDAVTEERNAARKKHEELRRLRLEMFLTGFGEITLKLKQMYQMITLGGDAELELVDSLDPFSEGIVFSVRPPKKSWKNIGNLSGGEKTLSSLALVFALHYYRPTPLYVMDEIDAALDFKNVSIVANYIKQRTRNAQFIIISLRNNMFELADRLVGIYKTNNCTKSVTVDPRAFNVQGQQNGIVPSTPALREKTNVKRLQTPISAVKASGRRRAEFEARESINNA